MPLDSDQRYVWHPYTQHAHPVKLLPVVKAAGSYLYLKNGKKIFDAISSWWVTLLGHCHPTISAAVASQAQTLDQVIFAGFTHTPATQLAKELIKLNAKQSALQKVFYSDNGSTAIEVALKMAFQYQQQQGRRKRTRFLALHNSYHGDTIGAMSVGEAELFQAFFKPLYFQTDFFLPSNVNQLKKLLKANRNRYAALIVEPLIQGAGGMKCYLPEHLEAIVNIARENKILVIFDEVFTGFFRTGKWFAYQHTRVSPDLMCVSKGLTGGTLPLAATLSTQSIYDAFLDSKLNKAFLHGHSYTANPISCRAALATLGELKKKLTQNAVQNIAEATQKALKALTHHPFVKETRQLGTIGVVELKVKNPGYFSEVSKILRPLSLQAGALIRPLGNVIYTVPPYSSTPAEIQAIYEGIEDNLNHKKIKDLLN